MRQLILLALVAVVAFATIPERRQTGIEEWDQYTIEHEAQYSRNIRDNSFKPNREYRFFYDGQVLNGIPHASKQHAGSRIQAEVVVQMVSAQQCVLKMRNIRMGKLNRKLHESPRRTLPFETFEPVSIEQEYREQLQMPVTFRYRDGMIQSVKFEKEDTPESENVKRGVMNLLQVNLKEHGTLENTDRRLNNEITGNKGQSKSFRVMETTIEGECETLYSVNKLPRHFSKLNRESSMVSAEQSESNNNMNVTKSINFDNCVQRPAVVYNYRDNRDCPDSCEQETTASNTKNQGHRFLKGSSVTKYDMAGDRDNFLIEKASSESQFNVELYSESESSIVVYMKQKLHLFESGPLSSRIQLSSPIDSPSGLMYNQEWDVLNEKFQAQADVDPEELANRPENIVEEITTLLREYARIVANTFAQPIPIRATSQFSLLVSALRKAKKSELDELHRIVVENKDNSLTPKELKVIKDTGAVALAAAGTDNCIHHLAKDIQRKSVTPSVATAALRHLHAPRIASQRTVKTLKALCESPEVMEHSSMKYACYLSLGSVMKAACVSRFDKSAWDRSANTRERCTMQDKQEFVDMLINKMKGANKMEDKVLFLKSLQNAGLDQSVFALEEIIGGRRSGSQSRYPIPVRVQAAMALSPLLAEMPQKIQRIMMPIYMDVQEPTVIRQAASFLIINCSPSRAVLDMMTKQIDVEPRRQVAIFTHKLMSDRSNSTKPCEQRLASDLKQSLRLCRRPLSGLYDTKYARNVFFDVVKSFGIDVETFMTMSESGAPLFTGMMVHSNIFGSYLKDRIDIGMQFDGLDNLVRDLLKGNERSWSLSDILSSSSPRRSGQSFIEQIAQKLNIAHRGSSRSRDATISANMIYHGQHIQHLAITQDLIEHLKEQGWFSKQSWESMFTSGQEKHVEWYHAVMMGDTQVKIPTPLGFPLVVKQKTPVIMKVVGSIKPTGSLSNMQLKLNLKPSIAKKSEETVEVWNPITPSGVRARMLLKAQLPMDAKLEIKSVQKQVRLIFKAPSESLKLMDVESEPITFTREPMSQRLVEKYAEERVVFAEEINRQQSFVKRTTQMGLPFSLWARYTPAQLNREDSRGRRWSPMCPLNGPNKMVLECHTSRDNTKEIELKVNFAGSRRANEPLSAKFFSTQFEDASSSQSQESGEIEREYTTSQTRFGEMVIELKNLGSSEPVHYQAKLRAIGGLKSRIQRLKAELNRISPASYQMCLESEVLYPEAASNIEDVQTTKIAHHTELKWGRTCSENNFVRISATAERTQEQFREEERSMSSYDECKKEGSESPLACEQYLRHASNLNKMSVVISYSNVPEMMQNATAKALRALEKYYKYETDVASIRVQNPQNKIRAELRVDPEDHRRVNITIKMPTENVTMTDIWMPSMPRVNARQSVWQTARRQYFSEQSVNEYENEPNQECRIGSGRVQTFDGQSYSAKLSKCYSVIAKDCSERGEFVVLAKKDPANPEHKIVKLVTQNCEAKLFKEGNQLKVKQNEKVYTPSSDNSQERDEDMMCTLKSDNLISCYDRRAGVEVLFDGRSVQVELDEQHNERTCGLCGHMNNYAEDDFQSPTFERRSDIRQFQREYIVNDDECEAVPELNEICEDESCKFEKDWSRSSSAESQQNQNEEDQESQEEPIEITKVIQKMDKLCFSKQPVKVCEDDETPSKKESKEVEYTCLDESDSDALEFQVKSEQMEVVNEVESLPTEFTRRERQPTVCKSFRNSYRRFD